MRLRLYRQSGLERHCSTTVNKEQLKQADARQIRLVRRLTDEEGKLKDSLGLSKPMCPSKRKTGYRVSLQHFMPKCRVYPLLIICCNESFPGKCRRMIDLKYYIIHQ